MDHSNCCIYYNVYYEPDLANAASIESDKFRTVTFPAIFIPAIRSSCT